MQFTWKGRAESPCTAAVLAAGKIVGADVTNQEADDGCLVGHDGTKYDGTVALRYLARLAPAAGLYGFGIFEETLVDQWIQKVCKLAGSGRDCINLDQSSWHRLRDSVETHLQNHTFLACERLTIADLLLAAALGSKEPELLGCKNLSDLPNVHRWIATIHSHPAIKALLPHCLTFDNDGTGRKKCTGAAGSTAKKSEEDTSKLTGEDLEESIAAEEEKARVKKANPLDSLPPTSFVLDAWKREYSNSKDLLGVSMPWFWEHYDAAGWSIWYMRYEKDAGENTVAFTTANMLGGFLQRLDNAFRKYSFAVLNVVGEPGNYDIQGVWMFRGKEIPAEMKEHPSFDYHSFCKLDPVAGKKLIEEYWTAEEEVEGRKIDSCKVWK